MSQKYADIIIDISHEALDRTFQYRIPEELEESVEIGSPVSVPFGRGNSKRTGYVIGISEVPVFDVDKIKNIDSIPKKGLAIEGKLIKLADWIRRNYGSTMIQALQTVMPVKAQVRKTEARVKLQGMELGTPPVIKLNADQQKIVDEFVRDNEYRQDSEIDNKTDDAESIQKDNESTAAVKSPVYLLYGITGSGKTEVYIECIKHCISKGKQAIVLIPEISLASQTVARFKQHFGDRVAVLHSELNKGERYRAVMSIKNHEADIIIGPRSALFSPCDNLGLIVMDEEHDGAYKSENTPAYHAREVAVERAKLENVPLILGSATPSLESYTMVRQGAFKLWRLDKRPDGRSLPEVHVVDMRQELRKGNRSIVSKELYEMIQERIERKEQVILFLNRRGYNSCLSCRDCGDTVMCPHCDVSLSLHKNNMLMCHYCGYTMKFPEKCPSCGSKMLGGFGVGTEKIEDELKKLFPGVKTLRLDRDSTTAKGARERILNSFRNHEADILVGTQMIVKGHDFPEVTLVGTIIADVSLFENDFRAGERTFQLLTQAAGRAGRGELSGYSIIQTYKPENYAIQAAKKQDYEDFYETEMTYRRLMKYPPVYNMLAILVQSTESELALRASEEISVILKKLIADNRSVKIIGPSDASIAKKNDRFRRVIYIKSADLAWLKKAMEIVDYYSMENVSVNMDMNPMSNY